MHSMFLFAYLFVSVLILFCREVLNLVKEPSRLNDMNVTDGSDS